jgi:hypothetical protein
MISRSIHRAAVAAITVTAMAAVAPNAARGQQVSVCYTKQNGTMYRVGVANTPSTCTNPTHTLETWGARIDANGVLSLNNANGLVAAGTIDQGNSPASGAGTRMMWFPAKAAFRAGTVSGTQWDAANVGVGSFSAGTNTTASGANAAAFGSSAQATGQASFAAGAFASATASNSVALGNQVHATGAGTFAAGVQSNASGQSAVAIGVNTMSTGSSAVAIGDGSVASGMSSVAIGSGVTSRGVGSVVMGTNAIASSTASGSFVFGDGTSSWAAPFTVTAPNSFIAQASGGVQFLSGPGGCTLAAGGGQWSCSSSRLLKTGFADVDGEEVLSKLRVMPVQSWSYTTEGAARHIGPMAQDFHAAFGLGSNDTTIGVLDAAGVSMAGVKALEARTTQLQSENTALRSAIAELGSRLAALETARGAGKHQ